MSDLFFLYILTIICTVYTGHETAIDLAKNFNGTLVGTLTGLGVGILSFILFSFTDRIMKKAEQNQEKSLWAIIGVSYFIFCIFVLLSSVIITGNITEKLLA